MADPDVALTEARNAYTRASLFGDNSDITAAEKQVAMAIVRKAEADQASNR